MRPEQARCGLFGWIGTAILPLAAALRLHPVMLVLVNDLLVEIKIDLFVEDSDADFVRYRYDPA